MWTWWLCHRLDWHCFRSPSNEIVGLEFRQCVVRIIPGFETKCLAVELFRRSHGVMRIKCENLVGFLWLARNRVADRIGRCGYLDLYGFR